MEFKIGDRVRVCANTVKALKSKMLYSDYADVHGAVPHVQRAGCKNCASESRAKLAWALPSAANFM